MVQRRGPDTRRATETFLDEWEATHGDKRNSEFYERLTLTLAADAVCLTVTEALRVGVLAGEALGLVERGEAIEEPPVPRRVTQVYTRQK